MALLDSLHRDAVEGILRTLRSSSDADRTLRTSASELKELIQCGGFVLMEGMEVVSTAGRVPAPGMLKALAPLLETQLKGRSCYWTDRLSATLPDAGLDDSIVSGLMATRIDTAERLLAVWLRPEQVEEIAWAGDPGIKEAAPAAFAPLSPRRSFATWRETVRGRSRPWAWYEINAVELFQSRAGHTLQRHRLKLLNIQLAEANAGLSELATIDPLTGLPNRRLFDERLAAEWARASAQGKSLGLIAIDIDHFKQYNDSFGHPAGDECLKQVAAAIDSARRAIDVAARMGGEEFAILLPGADAASTAAVAERVRRAVEALALQHPHAQGALVTISAGTAVASPADMADCSELIAAADSALYAAKASGRNRVAAGA
jgi:diguanylate cyclase (GGDEF)-like protein